MKETFNPTYLSLFPLGKGPSGKGMGIKMKKVYLLEDLDCAHCAEKIQEAVGKLDGVEKSTVTFLTQKLTVELAEGREKEIEKEIKKVVKKLEPEVTVKAKE